MSEPSAAWLGFGKGVEHLFLEGFITSFCGMSWRPEQPSPGERRCKHCEKSSYAKIADEVSASELETKP